MQTISKLNVVTLNPHEINVDALPDQLGEFEERCKICNKPKWRKLIDYMLVNGISAGRIVKYCNEHNLYEPKLIVTNVRLHRINHLKLDSSLAKVETDKDIPVTVGDLQSIEKQLADYSDERIASEVLRKAVAPYYGAGAKTPQIREAVSLLKAVQEKKSGEDKQAALVDFFKAIKSNPMIAAKAKEKRKITVSPIPGVQIEASIETGG